MLAIHGLTLEVLLNHPEFSCFKKVCLLFIILLIFRPSSINSFSYFVEVNPVKVFWLTYRRMW